MPRYGIIKALCEVGTVDPFSSVDEQNRVMASPDN
jgi:hypothetical protein